MTRRTCLCISLLGSFLILTGCTLDEGIASDPFRPGNGTPCSPYHPAPFFPTPPDQNPEYLYQCLTRNPNNPTQIAVDRYRPGAATDSIVTLDLSGQGTLSFVKAMDFPVSNLKWGSKDWLLVQSNEIQVMKSNGDSLRTVIQQDFSLQAPIGWNPEGDRFFVSKGNATYLFDLYSNSVDTVPGFVAYDWFENDSMVGSISFQGWPSEQLGIYSIQSRSGEGFMTYPVSSNAHLDFDGYIPMLALEMHNDGDHFSLLAGNSLWIGSRTAETCSEIMYFCFSRNVRGIQYLPQSDRLLIEESKGSVLSNFANHFERYIVKINPYTGYRYDTLWSFLP